MPDHSPPAELEIDERLARRLLLGQHPALADRPLLRLGEGWDNAMFRLGDDLAIRLPRREAAATLILNEQRSLPRIAQRLPLRTPVPTRLGRPDASFPWAWSVVPFLEGSEAAARPAHDADAARFVDFLRALHTPAPSDAPANPVRGCPLTERRASVEDRLEKLQATTDVVAPGVEAAWRAALAAPDASESVWLHGDLHPRNVLVHRDRFVAVIDWGDVTRGDAACDLASLWMLFEDPEVRREALARYGADEAMRARAIGWAILFAAILFSTGLRDSPRHRDVGEETFRRLAVELA